MLSGEASCYGTFVAIINLRLDVILHGLQGAAKK